MHAPPPAAPTVVRGRQLARGGIAQRHEQRLEIRGGDHRGRAAGFLTRPHVTLAALLRHPPLHRRRSQLKLHGDGGIAALARLVRHDHSCPECLRICFGHARSRSQVDRERKKLDQLR